MRPELQFVLLFSVATAVAIFTRRLQIPYSVALVAVGLGIGVFPFRSRPELTHDLLFAIALPGLLFEAAVHLREEWLAKTFTTIAALAIPGVIAGLFATAAVLLPLLHPSAGSFGRMDALAFAAVTVATDPIAVIATFRELRAPRRLAVIVEGESLLNDGTGVVIYNLVVAAAAGATPSVGSSALRFIEVSAGGALVGAVLAVAIVHLLRRLDEPMIEITLTVIAAYGSFAVAEQLGCSGVIATVVAGLVCGRAARAGAHSAETRATLHTFWEYVAFALNSIVFLLVGMQAKFVDLVHAWKPIAIGYGVLLAVRAGIVFTTTAALSRTRERIPARWAVVLSFCGLRGALAMVLALGLPPSFPSRKLIVDMTFGVVLLSIVLQGLTAGRLLRWMHIEEEPS